jgi:hypothetical protein
VLESNGDRTLLSILKAGAAQQLTVLSVELETHRKLLSSATTEKEKLEQRLQHLEKSLEDKSNECIFVAEESQVRLKFSFFKALFVKMPRQEERKDLSWLPWAIRRKSGNLTKGEGSVRLT